MASFSTVAAGDDATAININQYANALSGVSGVPISITAVNDQANFALDVRNSDANNGRTFRARDSSGNSRFQTANTSTAYVQADPDGSGLSVVATIGHPQTLSSKSFTNSSLSLLAASSNTVQVPHCRLTQTSTHTITHNTITALTFNVERWDNDSLHSTTTTPTRITPSRAGLWGMGGNVQWGASSVVSARDLYIRINGTTIIAPQRFVMPAGAGAADQVLYQSIYTEYELSTSDYIELCALQDTGISIEISTTNGPDFWASFKGSS